MRLNDINSLTPDIVNEFFDDISKFKKEEEYDYLKIIVIPIIINILVGIIFFSINHKTRCIWLAFFGNPSIKDYHFDCPSELSISTIFDLFNIRKILVTLEMCILITLLAFIWKRNVLRDNYYIRIELLLILVIWYSTNILMNIFSLFFLSIEGFFLIITFQVYLFLAMFAYLFYKRYHQYYFKNLEGFCDINKLSIQLETYLYTPELLKFFIICSYIYNSRESISIIIAFLKTVKLEVSIKEIMMSLESFLERKNSGNNLIKNQYIRNTIEYRTMRYSTEDCYQRKNSGKSLLIRKYQEIALIYNDIVNSLGDNDLELVRYSSMEEKDLMFNEDSLNNESLRNAHKQSDFTINSTSKETEENFVIINKSNALTKLIGSVEKLKEFLLNGVVLSNNIYNSYLNIMQYNAFKSNVDFVDSIILYLNHNETDLIEEIDIIIEMLSSQL